MIRRYAGIDSGSRKAGLTLLEHEPGEPLRLTYMNHIRMDLAGWEDTHERDRFHYLFTTLRLDLGMLEPDLVIVEHIRVRGGGRNLDTYLLSARGQQTAELAALDNNIPVVSLMANQVRSRLDIKGKGRDAQKKATMAKMNGIFEDAITEQGYFPLAGVKEDIGDSTALAMMGPFEAKRLGLL